MDNRELSLTNGKFGGCVVCAIHLCVRDSYRVNCAPCGASVLMPTSDGVRCGHSHRVLSSTNGNPLIGDTVSFPGRGSGVIREICAELCVEPAFKEPQRLSELS